MKLELKHLAPYLPYGLKVSSLHTLNAETGIGNINHIVKAVNQGKKQYKPRLRPLSDLNTKIYFKGNFIIPIEYIKNNFECFNFDYDDTFILSEDSVNYKYLPFMIICKLFEWHFDVFGLIEKGLAIDINDVVLADA